MSSVSCASAGNCAAVGLYQDRGGHAQMFAASQHQGRWGRAVEVPGLGALSKYGIADGSNVMSQVSCASPGNCLAGGTYTDKAKSLQGFLASERDGRWGDVMEMPGLGALNKGGGAGVDSVSCGAAGDCAAVGDYGEPYSDGFVVSEKNGVWGQAIDVPGLGALNGRIGGASSVSCASAGNCVLGGTYSDSSGGVNQGFVAVERHGRWGKATKLPGVIALNKGGDAWVEWVSCPPAGGCAAGGSYNDVPRSTSHFQGFVVSQTG